MAAAERGGRPTVADELRRRVEARQRCLRARIAACEELAAEMAALRAALAAARPGSPARQPPGPAGGSSAPDGGGTRSPEEPRRAAAAGECPGGAPAGPTRRDRRGSLRYGLRKSPAGRWRGRARGLTSQ